MFMIPKKNKLFLLVFLILSVFPVLSLFHPGLPLTHDGQDHVARIANFYSNLQEGSIIPRWAGNLNWGYGHPILEFLYPLPSYMASFFHFVGFSLVDSVKIVFGLGMILSLLFMYLWLVSFLGEIPAVLGAILYTYAPYRFVDLYVRGDIGENLAFAFIPLTLYFLYKLYKDQKYKYSIFGAISLAFLILSHNAISLMLMPFILVYCFYLIWLSKFNKYLILNTLFLILIGFSLSSFFWLPALFEGKYTLRNIVTKGTYIQSFATFKNLVYGPWSFGGTGQFTVQLGVASWISIFFSPFVLFYLHKKKNKNYILTLSLIIFTFFAIFLMLDQSSFIWSRFILLQNFQFPWRFLAVTVFTTSVLVAYLISTIPNKFKKYIFVLLLLIILFQSKDYIKANGYLSKKDSFFSGIYKSTTDTGESSPVWSVRFMEKGPKAYLDVIDGDAKIKNLQRSSTYHKYTIDVFKPTLFEENTLYFPGWEIKANGMPQNIEFQNKDYKGLMTFHLAKGSYIVEAIYKETKIRALSDAISTVVSLNIIGFLLFKFVKARLS